MCNCTKCKKMLFEEDQALIERLKVVLNHSSEKIGTIAQMKGKI